MRDIYYNSAPGPEDTRHLGDKRVDVLEVAKDLYRDDNVKCRISKWQRGPAANHERYVSLHSFVVGFGLGCKDHRTRDVEGHYLGYQKGGHKREPTSPCSYIKHSVSSL